MAYGWDFDACRSSATGRMEWGWILLLRLLAVTGTLVLLLCVEKR